MRRGSGAHDMLTGMGGHGARSFSHARDVFRFQGQARSTSCASSTEEKHRALCQDLNGGTNAVRHGTSTGKLTAWAQE